MDHSNIRKRRNSPSGERDDSKRRKYEDNELGYERYERDDYRDSPRGDSWEDDRNSRYSQEGRDERMNRDYRYQQGFRDTRDIMDVRDLRDHADFRREYRRDRNPQMYNDSPYGRSGRPNNRGFQKRGRGSFRGRGGKLSRQYIINSAKMKLNQIPPEKNNERDISEYFSRFGDIASIYCNTNKSFSIIEFQDSSAARLAVESPDAIFGNRFITAELLDSTPPQQEHHQGPPPNQYVQQGQYQSSFTRKMPIPNMHTREAFVYRSEDTQTPPKGIPPRVVHPRYQRRDSSSAAELKIQKKIEQLQEKFQVLQNKSQDLLKEIKALPKDKVEERTKLLGHLKDMKASMDRIQSRKEETLNSLTKLQEEAKNQKEESNTPVRPSQEFKMRVDETNSCISVRDFPNPNVDAIQEYFQKFGTINDFAIQEDEILIQFSDRKDAEDAIRNGRHYSENETLNIQWGEFPSQPPQSNPNPPTIPLSHLENTSNENQISDDEIDFRRN